MEAQSQTCKWFCNSQIDRMPPGGGNLDRGQRRTPKRTARGQFNMYHNTLHMCPYRQSLIYCDKINSPQGVYPTTNFSSYLLGNEMGTCPVSHRDQRHERDQTKSPSFKGRNERHSQMENRMKGLLWRRPWVSITLEND